MKAPAPAPHTRTQPAKGTSAALRLPEIEAALLAPYPVLSSSQFCLELMAQGKALDLRQAADLLGRDPGAVLRVFAAVALEFPNPADRPVRLNDCIMSLCTADIVAALHTPASSRREQVPYGPFARHAHLISRYAIVVAASLGLDQESAQIVGLLHDLRNLPAALGRGPVQPDGEALCAQSAAIAKLHQVPADLAAAVSAVGRGDSASVWVALIEAAHDLAASAGTVRETPSEHDFAWKRDI